MSRLMSVLSVLFLLCAAVGCAPTPKMSALQGMPEGAPTETIHITAEKYKFTPDTIRVKKGTHVVIEIESLDVRHEFKLEAYDIYVKIPAKETVKVEFYASKSGEFGFGCHVGLGMHYALGMKGTLIVEE